MTIIFPSKSIRFKDWVCSLIQSTPHLYIPLPTRGEEKWRDWVNNLISLNTKTFIPFPTKNYTWRQWAILFIQSYQTKNI